MKNNMSSITPTNEKHNQPIINGRRPYITFIIMENIGLFLIQTFHRPIKSSPTINIQNTEPRKAVIEYRLTCSFGDLIK